MLETEIGSQIVRYLEAEGWDVYQEVRAAYGDPVADIVGVCAQGTAKVVWVIECKLSLSLALLDQALGWVHFAHYVSIAIPRLKRGNKHRSAEVLLHDQGIGWLSVDERPPVSVSELIKPVLHRKAYTRRLLDSLTDEQKHVCAAGSRGGGYWTPFAGTCQELARIAKQTPGISLKDAINSAGHHYRSSQTARTCIARALDMGWVKGVVGKKEGGKWCLYPA